MTATLSTEAAVDILSREIRSPEELTALTREGWKTCGVLDAVRVLSPVTDGKPTERPTHLRAMANFFRRAEAAAHGDGPPVLALVSAPPQIGKTKLGQHALARWLARHPTDNLAYLAYGDQLARTKSKEVRTLARAAGVELMDDTTAADLWRTTAGGGLLARSLEGGITGHSGLAMVWIDDPYKGRAQVESTKERQNVLDGIRSNVFSRLSPRASLLISHTRWHADDLIGVLSRDPLLKDRFEVVRLAACEPDGTPIITLGGRDRAFYEQQRALSEYDWHSLYMGEPRPREGRLFRSAESMTYAHRPNEMQIAIGVDFAYSSKTSADYSVAVVLGRTDHRRYVLDVVRRQCSATEFAAELRALRLRYPAAGMHAYIGGTELGVVDLLRTQGIALSAKQDRRDKHSRAISCAEAWSRGDVLMPEQAPWLSEFVGEVADFSGKGDAHDDQVDALVAAFDALGIGQSAQVAHRPLALAKPWEVRRGEGAAEQSGGVTPMTIRKRWE